MFEEQWTPENFGNCIEAVLTTHRRAIAAFYPLPLPLSVSMLLSRAPQWSLTGIPALITPLQPLRLYCRSNRLLYVRQNWLGFNYVRKCFNRKAHCDLPRSVKTVVCVEPPGCWYRLWGWRGTKLWCSWCEISLENYGKWGGGLWVRGKVCLTAALSY